mmetsp:Transcript_16464/g.39411  ORF Transcript_16464/g.39411 Transcript_16464/m.39411 type:complete len:285 (+) Transcript_16464:181-1035(+)|eukprot:CAMPEP_0181112818 /NCGR_PEP_ID=MMETSP1071-20121207/20013_1 /TAXON_ID=35127 /ORGANISM="Thalassiosira sp., Strain NH16" /LENGTH=284 /DNA_ID=CAMNT_0023196807 /DNA_START=135 /DNA_END=989 /DNA_ORIENTATION=+
MSSQLPRFSTDSKKKKSALPSLLSNIRNAQAVIGRAAADDVHDRENRPLVNAGGGARTAVPSTHPQLSRSASSASFSATLHNFSQRFGSQWRKRSQRKKGGHGVTVVPQTFFLAVGCFFFAFPLFFVLYILARHAVFGDEGEISGSQVHVHEVPASLGNLLESGKVLPEMNAFDIDNPEDEKKIMYSGLNQTSVHEDASITLDAQVMEGSDIPAVEIESATGVLHNEVGQTVGDNLEQNVRKKVPMTETNNVDGNIMEDSTSNLQHGTMQNVTSEGDTNNLVRN